MRRRSVYGFAAAVAGVALGVFGVPRALAGDEHHDRDEGDSRVREGFRIAPVELDLRGKDRALVGLGSYLVNAVADCSGCHTQPEFLPGGDPHMGQPKRINVDAYLAGGGTPFGPVFVPRNLTPDKDGLPAGHTFAAFHLILTTGIDLDQAHPQFGPLLQVMPWTTFQNMTDRDLRAIYEYLRAIPCREGGPMEPPNRCH